MTKTIALIKAPQRHSETAATVADAHTARPNTNPTRHLYIHIPFCFHKCHYCDFYSIVDNRDRQQAFTQRLQQELQALAPVTQDAPLRTIFVGGGTPTLLRTDLWQQLLETINRHFNLTDIRANAAGTEWTVECNPETATRELFDTLVAGGVNRVSIGAQSFNTQHLKTLERWHDPENVGKALRLARAAGIARRSLDLIFAIPGQTIEEWTQDLDHALSLGVEHMSCYALTYEPGTAMTKRLELGRFTPAPEDRELQMMRTTRARLAQAGLERYEISNFAKPGQESAHNIAYWTQADWLAAGPSASGHLAGRRWKNTPRLDDYLNVSDQGYAPIIDHEPPNPTRNLAELFMTGLRLQQGLDAQRVRTQAHQLAVTDALEAVIEQLRADTLLARDPERLRLTDRGFELANHVCAELMFAVDP